MTTSSLQQAIEIAIDRLMQHRIGQHGFGDPDECDATCIECVILTHNLERLKKMQVRFADPGENVNRFLDGDKPGEFAEMLASLLLPRKGAA